MLVGFSLILLAIWFVFFCQFMNTVFLPTKFGGIYLVNCRFGIVCLIDFTLTWVDEVKCCRSCYVGAYCLLWIFIYFTSRLMSILKLAMFPVLNDHAQTVLLLNCLQALEICKIQKKFCHFSLAHNTPKDTYDLMFYLSTQKLVYSTIKLGNPSKGSQYTESI